MIVKNRYKIIVRCDGCDAELPTEYEYMDAVAAMKRAGWGTVASRSSAEWFNFCPVCNAKRKG